MPVTLADKNRSCHQAREAGQGECHPVANVQVSAKRTMAVAPCLVWLQALVIMVTLIGTTTTVRAEDDEAPPPDLLQPMSPKLVVKPLLGLGGDVNDADLDPTFGGAVHYEHPIVELFVLGAYAGIQSWNTTVGNDLGLGRSTLIDISVLPKVRVALNERLELYIAVPVGLTIDFADGASLGGSDANTGIGWNLQPMFGGQFAIVDGFGIMGEMGYMLHKFSHTLTPSTPGASEADVDVDMQQFLITAGVFIAL